MMPLEEVEDLIVRVAMGDRAAFTTLYERTSPKLFGICVRVLEDRIEAEEVLQEVYVTVWFKAENFRADGLSPAAWLIGLARSCALDRRRHMPKRPPVPIDTADLLPDRSISHVGQMATGKVAQCLDTLPRARAHLLRRVCLDGDSYADLADASGVTPDAIRPSLRRSLIALRECLTR